MNHFVSASLQGFHLLGHIAYAVVPAAQSRYKQLRGLAENPCMLLEEIKESLIFR